MNFRVNKFFNKIISLKRVLLVKTHFSPPDTSSGFYSEIQKKKIIPSLKNYSINQGNIFILNTKEWTSSPLILFHTK
jgi:hypothetical protein